MPARKFWNLQAQKGVCRLTESNPSHCLVVFVVQWLSALILTPPLTYPTLFDCEFYSISEFVGLPSQIWVWVNCPSHCLKLSLSVQWLSTLTLLLTLFDCEFSSISGHLKTWGSGVGFTAWQRINKYSVWNS
jgi:hypothetical protein